MNVTIGYISELEPTRLKGNQDLQINRQATGEAH